MQKSKKTTKKTPLLWPALIIAAIVLIVSVSAIALKTIGNSKTFVKTNKEFSMKAGDEVYLSDIEDTTLKLEVIEDSRCPSGGDIVCIWQGELRYQFSYKENLITIGSVLEPQHTLGDSGYILHFVSGDETAGTFVLRKEEK